MTSFNNWTTNLWGMGRITLNMVVSNSLHDLLEPIRNKLRLIVGENLFRHPYVANVPLCISTVLVVMVCDISNIPPHFKCISGMKKKNFPWNFQKNLFNMLQWVSRLTPKMEQSWDRVQFDGMTRQTWSFHFLQSTTTTICNRVYRYVPWWVLIVTRFFCSNEHWWWENNV